VIAVMPVWVQSAAIDLGVLAGLIASGGVFMKTRAGKAVAGFVRRTYRRAFGQPFTAWLVTSIQAAVKPEIDALSLRNDEQHAENADRLEAIERRVAVVETNVEVTARVLSQHSNRLDKGSEAMGQIRTTLDSLATDVAALTRRPSLPSKEDPAS
jgi:hypothetical protein